MAKKKRDKAKKDKRAKRAKKEKKSREAERGDSSEPPLTRIGAAEIPIEDLSGLAYHPERRTLFTVSDRGGQVWELDPEDGTIVGEVTLEGARKLDLEGLAIGSDGHLWLAEERSRRILRFDLEGARIGEHEIEVEGRRENDGLEGLSVDRSSGRIFALHERRPRLLLELDKDLKVIHEQPIEELDDLSGVCADGGALWILSDDSEALALYEEEGDRWVLQRTWPLGRDAAEGIALVGDRVYVAFDQGRENLVWYRRPE